MDDFGWNSTVLSSIFSQGSSQNIEAEREEQLEKLIHQRIMSSETVQAIKEGNSELVALKGEVKILQDEMKAMREAFNVKINMLQSDMTKSNIEADKMRRIEWAILNYTSPVFSHHQISVDKCDGSQYTRYNNIMRGILLAFRKGNGFLMPTITNPEAQSRFNEQVGMAVESLTGCKPHITMGGDNSYVIYYS